MEGDNRIRQHGLRKNVSGRKTLRLISVQESETTFGKKMEDKLKRSNINSNKALCSYIHIKNLSVDCVIISFDFGRNPNMGNMKIT